MYQRPSRYNAPPSAEETVAPRRAATLVPVAFAIAALGCPAPPERTVAGDASAGLVFVKRVGAHDELYRARLSDGEVRAFLPAPHLDATWPFWSQASGRLVYQTEPQGGGAADLQVWKPGEPAPQPLTATPARDDRWAAWSPDGAHVVFAYRDPGRDAAIAAIEVPGGRESLLAASGLHDFFFRPSYAPDGRRIVAQRRDLEGHGSTLWILDPPAPPRRLTREEGWQEDKPSFTRDGTSVVFSREQGDGPRGLARVGSDGQVASIPAAKPGADEHSARASPTRDEICFVSDRDGSRDVFLAPLDGGPARNLTRTPDRDELAPHWSPDGERLVATAVPPRPPGRAGEKLDPAETRLVVLDRSGKVLFETPGMMADWMPPF